MPELKDVKRLAAVVRIIVGPRLPTVSAYAPPPSADKRCGFGIDIKGVELVATRCAFRAAARHRMSR